MTFHRRAPNTNTLTVAAMAAALAAVPTGGAEVFEHQSTSRRTATGFDEPIIGRPGKYRGPRNKPPSQKKRRLNDRRRGRFS